MFSLFTPADIRRTRDHALSNFETLLLSITSRLTVLKNHPSFPDPELAPDRDALNCIRILTRVLPFIYEAEHLEEWEEKFFWARRKRKTREAQVATEVLFDEAQAEGRDRASPRASDYEDVKPLAEELIDTLLDLLFFTDFTIPKLPTAKSKVSYSIWQSGVGCNTSMGSNKELENNRCEILRLLLTLTGKAMYMPSSKCCSLWIGRTQLTVTRSAARARRQGHHLHCDMPRQASCVNVAVLFVKHCTFENWSQSSELMLTVFIGCEIQSRFLEGTIRSRCMEGSQADLGHLLPAVFTSAPPIPGPRRWSRKPTEELLPPLLRSTTSAARLSILS